MPKVLSTELAGAPVPVRVALGSLREPRKGRRAVRKLLILLLAVMPVQVIAQPVSKPERRVAFVVGIGAYQNAPRLANPLNDARAVGDALRRLGFEVDEVYDPDFLQLTRPAGIRHQGGSNRMWLSLTILAKGCRSTQENYLLPADAQLEREHDLVYEALPLGLFSARSLRLRSWELSCWTPAATIRSSSAKRARRRRSKPRPGGGRSGARGCRAAQHTGSDGDQGGSGRRGRQQRPQSRSRGRCSRIWTGLAWNSACSSAACGKAS